MATQTREITITDPELVSIGKKLKAITAYGCKAGDKTYAELSAAYAKRLKEIST